MTILNHNLFRQIDGVGGPIDLMRPGELHGRDGLGGHLVIPPYNYREQ